MNYGMFTMFFFSEWTKNVTGSRGKSSETLGLRIFSSRPTQAFMFGMQVKLLSSHSLFPECLLNSTLSTYLLFSMIILPGLHTGRNTIKQPVFFWCVCGVLKRVRLCDFRCNTCSRSPPSDYRLAAADCMPVSSGSVTQSSANVRHTLPM